MYRCLCHIQHLLLHLMLLYCAAWIKMIRISLYDTHNGCACVFVRIWKAWNDKERNWSDIFFQGELSVVCVWIVILNKIEQLSFLIGVELSSKTTRQRLVQKYIEPGVHQGILNTHSCCCCRMRHTRCLFSHWIAVSSADWRRRMPLSSLLMGQDSTMWYIVSVLLQAHKSDDDRPQFFRQDAQRPWRVLNRFKVHHCARGRLKSRKRTVGLSYLSTRRSKSSGYEPHAVIQLNIDQVCVGWVKTNRGIPPQNSKEPMKIAADCWHVLLGACKL